MGKSSRRVRDLLARGRKPEFPRQNGGNSTVQGYTAESGQYQVQNPDGSITESQLKTSGGLGLNDPVLANSGFIVAKPHIDRRKKSIRSLVEKSRFKVLFQVSTASSPIVEFFVGGDSSPRLVFELNENNFVLRWAAIVNTGFEPDEYRAFIYYIGTGDIQYMAVIDGGKAPRIISGGDPTVTMTYYGYGFFTSSPRRIIAEGNIDSYDETQLTKQNLGNFTVSGFEWYPLVSFDPSGAQPPSCQFRREFVRVDKVITTRHQRSGSREYYPVRATYYEGFSDPFAIKTTTGFFDVELRGETTQRIQCAAENQVTDVEGRPPEHCIVPPYFIPFEYPPLCTPGDTDPFPIVIDSYERREEIATFPIYPGRFITLTNGTGAVPFPRLVGRTSRIFALGSTTYFNDGEDKVITGFQQTDARIADLYGLFLYRYDRQLFQQNSTREWDYVFTERNVLTGEASDLQAKIKSLETVNPFPWSISYYNENAA